MRLAVSISGVGDVRRRGESIRFAALAGAAARAGNSTLLWHLHDLWPELRLPGGALFSKKWGTRIGRRLARAEQSMRVRIVRDELRRLRD